jgi:hypothetical protein
VSRDQGAELGHASPEAATVASGPAAQESRIARWWRTRTPPLPTFVWPAAVVLVTGLLGRHHSAKPVVVWLSFVSGWSASVLIAIAFEDAPYARRASRVVGVIVALIALALLSRQAHVSFLGDPSTKSN